MVHVFISYAALDRAIADGSWRAGDNPFPGLEPFTPEFSRVFFSRAAEAREVLNRLHAMHSTAGILAIVGPSGCEKSSLLTGHTNEVIDLTFAPDGRTLATTSNDQTVILWQPPRPGNVSGNEVREACLRAGGPLDEATWGQFAPGVSYQDTCADH